MSTIPLCPSCHQPMKRAGFREWGIENPKREQMWACANKSCPRFRRRTTKVNHLQSEAV